jgi:hypothetical protein
VLRWLWTHPPESVPPGVPPVTEPAECIEETRRTYGWPTNQPVFGCDGGVLRLWSDGDHWFLDDRIVSPMGDQAATFAWCFQGLEGAIDAALLFFEDKAAGKEKRIGEEQRTA